METGDNVNHRFQTSLKFQRVYVWHVDVELFSHLDYKSGAFSMIRFCICSKKKKGFCLVPRIGGECTPATTYSLLPIYSEHSVYLVKNM